MEFYLNDESDEDYFQDDEDELEESLKEQYLEQKKTTNVNAIKRATKEIQTVDLIQISQKKKKKKKMSLKNEKTGTKSNQWGKKNKKEILYVTKPAEIDYGGKSLFEKLKASKRREKRQKNKLYANKQNSYRKIVREKKIKNARLSQGVEFQFMMKKTKGMKFTEVELDDEDVNKMLQNKNLHCWGDSNFIYGMVEEQKDLHIMKVDLVEESTLIGKVEIGEEFSEYLGKRCFSFQKDNEYSFHFNGSGKILLVNKNILEKNSMMLVEMYDHYLDEKNNCCQKIIAQEVVDFEAIYCNRRVFVFGGYYDDEKTMLTNQLFVITETEPMVIPFQKRSGKKYMKDLNEKYTDGSVFSIFLKNSRSVKKNNFTKYPIKSRNESPLPRVGHSMASSNNNIYLFGGMDENGSLLNDLWVFDTIVENFIIWRKIEYKMGLTVPFLKNASLINLDNLRLLLHGGENEDKKIENKTYYFDIKKEKWYPVELIENNNYLNLAGHYVSQTSFFNEFYIIGGETTNKKDEKIRNGSIYKLFKTFNEVDCNILEYDSSLKNFKIISNYENESKELMCHKCFLFSRSIFYKNYLLENENSNEYKTSKYPIKIIKMYINFIETGNLSISNEYIDNFVNLVEEWGNFKLIEKVLCSPSFSELHDIFRFFIESNRELLKSEKFSDMKIILPRENNKEFKVHKVFLFQSGFVQKMLTSGMREEAEGSIFLENLSEYGGKAIIDYFYTQKLDKLDNINAIEIYLFSIIFELIDLKETSEKIILRLISTETVIPLFGMFLFYKNTKIFLRCNEFIYTNSYILDDFDFDECRKNNEELCNHLETIKTGIKMDKQKFKLKNNQKKKSKKQNNAPKPILSIKGLDKAIKLFPTNLQIIEFKERKYLKYFVNFIVSNYFIKRISEVHLETGIRADLFSFVYGRSKWRRGKKTIVELFRNNHQNNKEFMEKLKELVSDEK